MLYGVLNVYAGWPEAFDAEERAVVGQLGELVGYAIAAVERKRALTSDEIIELEFQAPNVFDTLGLDVDAPADGTITFDRTVPIGDGSYLEYGTATDGSFEVIETLVASDLLSHWVAVTVLEDANETTRFEVRLDDPPVVSLVAAHGGYVHRATIEDGDFSMRIHLAPGTDVHTVTDAIESAYPNVQMMTRRQVHRARPSLARLRRTLDETLTDRQRTALEAAYAAGFFEWPRDSSGEEVAQSMGISAPTFHQHLRAAQKGLVSTVLDDRLETAA
jgi:hypothetical protein